MNHKKYITINATQVDNINWDTQNVIEIKDTLRYSLDNSKFIIKWNEGYATPPSVAAIPSEDKSNVMSHEEVRILMKDSAWTDPNAIP